MPVALLDTNAVSDLMRDQPQVRARVANHSGPLISSVVVWGEIHYGLERLPAGKKRAALEARAQAIHGTLPCEPVTGAGQSAAEQFRGLLARCTVGRLGQPTTSTSTPVAFLSSQELKNNV
jgi:predicted nucleic acid-binding protein